MTTTLKIHPFALISIGAVIEGQSEQESFGSIFDGGAGLWRIFSLLSGAGCRAQAGSEAGCDEGDRDPNELQKAIKKEGWSAYGIVVVKTECRISSMAC